MSKIDITDKRFLDYYRNDPLFHQMVSIGLDKDSIIFQLLQDKDHIKSAYENHLIKCGYIEPIELQQSSEAVNENLSK